MLSRKTTTRGGIFSSPGPSCSGDARKARRTRTYTTIEVIGFLCFCVVIFVGASLQAPHLFHSYKDIARWNQHERQLQQQSSDSSVAGLSSPLNLGSGKVIIHDSPPLLPFSSTSSASVAAGAGAAVVETSKLATLAAAAAAATATMEAATKLATETAAATQEKVETVSNKRQEAVRNAMLHAWEGYSTFAWGHDELRPSSNITNDSWNGWGVTIFDGLDTLMLMGLDAQVKRVREHIAKVDFVIDYGVSFFETTIRYLGGLLSAFALSKDQFYLDRAKSLAELLIKGFENTKSGFPESVLNLKTHTSHNHAWNGNCLLSEIGSSQIEYAFLSYFSGDVSFFKKSREVYTRLDRLKKPFTGLYPVFLNADTGEFASDRISFGSLADSFYEYLLKLYLLNGDQDSLRMYNEAIVGMKEHLIKTVTYESETESGDKITRKHVFIGEMQGTTSVPTMEHLTCFVPGMLALAAHLIPQIPSHNRTVYEEARAQLAAEDLLLAEELVSTCVGTYFDSSTGLGAESISFHTDQKHQTSKKQLPGDHVHDMYDMFEIQNAKYILRPETIESLFVLWRVTGNPKYQEWGWAIFQALEKHCRTPSAYSGLKNVDRKHTGDEEHDIRENWDNSMQSFFWAETLKYLYLLFSPPSSLPLHLYVFTTEAHPLSVLPGGIADRVVPDSVKS